MSQLIFELKQDLVLPATGNPNKGYLLFPKALFGLSYAVTPDPKKRTLSVLLAVAELATQEVCWPLTIYEVTDKGFATSEYVNQTAYDAYIVEKTAIEDAINVIFSELDALTSAQELIEDVDSQEYMDLQTSIDTKRAESNAKILELQKLVPVELQTLFINKYDDVVLYFKGDGSLTDEGVEWAKTVRYGNITLGDLIV